MTEPTVNRDRGQWLHGLGNGLVHRESRSQTRPARVWQGLENAVILALTLLPIWHIFNIMISTGANNLSSDTLVLFVPLVTQVLEGSYDWSHYFRDTFLRSHSIAIPTLIRILAAACSHWNTYVELYIGMGISLLNVWLLHNLLTHLSPYRRRKWLWPLVSALVFSTSQIVVFTYGDTSLAVLLGLFAVLLGSWGLSRFPGQWQGIGIMATGGIMASWCWGAGLAAWPAFLLGMGLLKFRRLWHYLAYGLAAGIGLWPYVLYYGVYVLLGQTQRVEAPKGLDGSLILRALGYPFAIGSEYERSQTVGLVGLALAVTGLGLLGWQRRRWQQAAPALMLIVYGLVVVLQITVARGNLAPWYVTPFMSFWMGLLGLAYVLGGHRADSLTSPMGQWVTAGTARLWSLTFLASLTFLYVTSNLTSGDKMHYIYSRSPVSAACLRHYQTAPTYCEQYVFIWGVGLVDMLNQRAAILDRHQLSVFAPQQHWTLQGDFVLDSVQVAEATPEVVWSPDWGQTTLPFSDYRHLNLVLPTPSAITWTISLPENLEAAKFQTAIALGTAPMASPQPLTATIELEGSNPSQSFHISQRLRAEPAHWYPVQFSLKQYRGQTITLRLSSQGDRGTPVVYRHPSIDLTIGPSDAWGLDAATEIQPTNTERSPQLPQPSNQDFPWDIHNAALWKVSGMTVVPGTGIPSWQVTADTPSLTFQPPLNICLANYSHFLVQLAADSNFSPRALQLYYQLNGESNFSDSHALQIPLLSDSQMHTYTYDLKLLELHPSDRLTGFRLHPIARATATGNNRVAIADLRLIKTAPAGGCGP
ncbi:hypothetical protein DO97_03985 [Neosynechococcus sphagnicola sy1]|uniref:Uncharacterized protein n=1 Tax=Neosynechococcus sphagnicola sy1 TaxID=1497020 RepID=A0A098TPX4_9CYAN|nr:hypothetical protein [Neosynechococcus sphagnicola]KGF72878.1 hypothetical protein DO97_03985 [Neosynechococcus sphagnicola sy1]